MTTIATMRTYAEALENFPITFEIYMKCNTPCIYLSTENGTGCEYPVTSMQDIADHFSDFLASTLEDVEAGEFWEDTKE